MTTAGNCVPMMVKTIAVQNNEYSERDIAYDKLTQYNWSIYKNFDRSGFELYYIQPLDSDDKNELATKLIQKEVVGSLIFVKVSRTSIVNIDITDLPDLMEGSLMFGFDSFTFGYCNTSDMSTDNDTETKTTPNEPADSNVSYGIDTVNVQDMTDSEFNAFVDDQAMYDDDEYYNYHAGYDSY